MAKARVSAGQNGPSGSRRWLRFFGFRPDAGRRYGVAFTGLFVVWVLFFVAAALTFASFSWTSRPGFCRTCHNIRPYYESWDRSTHRRVNCLDCHFEPGLWHYLKAKSLSVNEVVQYVTGAFDPRPRSRISDVSCLRSGCHEKADLAEHIRIQVERPGKVRLAVRFGHGRHLEKMGDLQLRCVSCHISVTHENHFEIRPGVCFLCHLGAGGPRLAGRDRECTVCHDAPVGAIRLVTGTYNHAEYVGRGVDCRACHLDSVRGQGEVPTENCLHCHAEMGKLARRAEKAFIHEAHVATHHAECFDCHLPVEHGVAPLEMELVSGCRSCHRPEHELAKSLYMGRGGRGVPDMPGPMYRAHVDCEGCHQPERLAEPAPHGSVARASCSACHGSRYKTMVDTWRKMADSLTASVEASIEEAEGQMAGVPDGIAAPARALLEDARSNLRMVKEGNAVHNINYALALLNVARERAQEAGSRLKKTASPSKE